jgi:hypothetical protein
MQTTKVKTHKQTSHPFSLEITDDRLLVNVNLPLRRTLIVLGTLVGSPLVAEFMRTLLAGH